MHENPLLNPGVEPESRVFAAGRSLCWGLAALQGGAFALALFMVAMTRQPWLIVAALVSLSLAALLGPAVPKVSGASFPIAALSTCIVALSIIVSGVQMRALSSYLDAYYGGVACLVALGLAVSRWRVAPYRARRFEALAMVWLAAAAALCLGSAYITQEKVLFYICWFGLILLAVFCHLRFRLRTVGFQLLNCFIFVAAGLVVVDLFIQPGYGLRADAQTRRNYYGYERAKRDPTAFARWWAFYLARWEQSQRELTVPDPEGRLPLRLRPNSSSMFFQHLIRINSNGFRGREFSREKGGAYRIIALGESTTFGITLNAEDRPWPEILEQLIAERLTPARRVEVINAGVPGYHLDNNLYRLSSELLDLEPDMVISYHGLNGFLMLHGALPSTIGSSTAPVYRERPLRILANCEYKWKVRRFKQGQVAALRRAPPTVTEPMNTPCANAYRRLCDIAHTNRIRLVLATYSMAVNTNSPPEALEFYQASYPAAPWYVPANVLHSQVVREVSREHPETCFIDTAPGLDGVPENFLDLVHFSPAGEGRLAETMFAGIENVLRAELSQGHAGTPR